MRTRITIVAFVVLGVAMRGYAQNEACCLEGGGCIDITPEFCKLLFMGSPQGPGTSCAEGGCLGACVVDGECSDDVNIFDCEAAGGLYQGSGSTCADLMGACCVDLFDCVLTGSEADCEAQGGSWYGLGIRCEDVEDCDGSLGACCLIDTCVDSTSEDDCRFRLRGFWRGPLTSCADGACPPIGACCVKETAKCFDGTSEDVCESGKFGTGRFQGGGTTCEDVSCPIFGFGACCLPDGECWDFVEESECRFVLDGTYAGDNVSCEEADCPCPPDVTGDDEVTFEDLLVLLGNWGPYDPCPPYQPGDVNRDCAVAFDDLLILLSAWGRCP